MFRLSEREAAKAGLLFPTKRKARRKSQKRTRKAKSTLGENQVEAQITDFLRLHGWLVTRQQVGVFVAYYNYAKKVQNAPVIRVGEKGMADWIAIRSLPKLTSIELAYLELKAPGKRPSPEQEAWLYKRRAIGLQADWFDCFESGGKKPFLPWYRERFGD